jgi:hypothetical protein
VADQPILEKGGLQFEMRLNSKHVFDRWHLDADYKIDQTGVRLILGPTPTPFTIQTMFPGNSHAMVSFKISHTNLTSDCYKTTDRYPVSKLFSSFYTHEACFAEGVEEASMDLCDCHFTAGNYFPRNEKICTPAMVKNCVRKKVVAADIGDEANRTSVRYKKLMHAVTKISL